MGKKIVLSMVVSSDIGTNHGLQALRLLFSL